MVEKLKLDGDWLKWVFIGIISAGTGGATSAFTRPATPVTVELKIDDKDFLSRLAVVETNTAALTNLEGKVSTLDNRVRENEKILAKIGVAIEGLATTTNKLDATLQLLVKQELGARK